MPYPAARFDNTDVVQQTIPSFWTDIYGGRDLVDDFIRAANAQERQLNRLEQELFDSMGRLTCPVYHTDLWLPVELREDEGVAASLLHFGDDLIYGPQDDTEETYTYGGAFDSSWQFPLPADVVAASLLTDGIVNQTVAMGGAEFRINPRSGFLTLAQNPFQDSRFTPFTGQDGIRRIRVYLFAAQRDWRYMATLYGSVIGAEQDSSPAYRDFVNAVLDASTTGTAMSQIYAAFAAMSGIPFAEGDETVEDVTADASWQLVITDRNVYKVPATATVLVAVGDELTPRQPLADTVTIDEMASEVPDGLTSLTLGSGYLAAGIGPLTFEDADSDLVVEEDVDGFTKVTFDVTGDSNDVAAFFDAMHTRGVSAGGTLANYLDLRESPTSEPTALNLPTTINPLQFVIANVLRGVICLVRVKTADLSSLGIGIDRIDILHRIMPPHAALIMIEE